MSILAAEIETETLSVENVSLYYGAAQALRGVSLQAPVGEVSAVMGRNGTGKTSLMRAITGRAPISSGRILLGSSDLTRMAPYARARAGVGSCPQGREIFPLLSVRENLETGYAGLPRGQRDIPDEVYDLFPILHEMAHRRGGDLSGGQQQQLAIARAMIMRPKVLLLDEPTEGIQPNIIQQIGRVIDYLRAKGDMAIILVEQYFDFAYGLGDHFYVLKRGAVTLSQPKEGLSRAALQQTLSI